MMYAQKMREISVPVLDELLGGMFINSAVTKAPPIVRTHMCNRAVCVRDERNCAYLSPRVDVIGHWLSHALSVLHHVLM
eukprot:m.573792 g.573792  ORF g.573792 m.573792 type:complete len:79 (+) comp22279_c0_seq30:2189-2425(+)